MPFSDSNYVHTADRLYRAVQMFLLVVRVEAEPSVIIVSSDGVALRHLQQEQCMKMVLQTLHALT